MSNKANFRKAKMNINSAITTPYENALLRSTEKTNPISSALPNAGCIAKDARKACRQVLAIANRFFETVARINEGPLGENQGDFGGNRGKTGGIGGFSRKIGVFTD